MALPERKRTIIRFRCDTTVAILEGFARIQDVLKEADLSAGAVYRYFSGKDELITRQSPPPPDVLVGEVLARALGSRETLSADAEVAFPRLIMQVWAEAARNPELAGVVDEVYGVVTTA